MVPYNPPEQHRCLRMVVSVEFQTGGSLGCSGRSLVCQFLCQLGLRFLALCRTTLQKANLAEPA
jgi:hypothetical protein